MLAVASASTTKKWWEKALQVGSVTAYRLDLGPGPAREAEALALLDDYERARAQRFTTSGPRRRFILCRAALRFILCTHLGCSNEQLTIGSSYYEKPYAIVGGRSHPISFNVSHSGNNGLIGLGQGNRIGVDIEEWNPHRSLDLLIETAFTPAERTALESTNVIQRQHFFFRLWTIKEALIKAVGMGLSLDMSSFEVPVAMRCGAASAEFHFPQAPLVAWRLDTIAGGSYYGAIAQELIPPLPSYQLDKDSKALRVSTT